MPSRQQKKPHAYFVNGDENLPDTPLSELCLPTRAKNALLNGGIKSLSDILEWPVHEVRALPNCGDTTVTAIKRIVNSLRESGSGASVQ